jgi:hypothetical protein
MQASRCGFPSQGTGYSGRMTQPSNIPASSTVERRAGISKPWITALVIGAVVAGVDIIAKPHHRSVGAALIAALLIWIVIAAIARLMIGLIQRTA